MNSIIRQSIKIIPILRLNNKRLRILAVDNCLIQIKLLLWLNDKTTNWVFWTSYSNGHAWVCDGVSSSYYCEIGVSTLYFHMNWGWEDTGYGWYAFNGSWNAEGSGMTFPYKRGMIYNIRP